MAGKSSRLETELGIGGSEGGLEIDCVEVSHEPTVLARFMACSLWRSWKVHEGDDEDEVGSRGEHCGFGLDFADFRKTKSHRIESGTSIWFGRFVNNMIKSNPNHPVKSTNTLKFHPQN